MNGADLGIFQHAHFHPTLLSRCPQRRNCTLQGGCSPAEHVIFLPTRVDPEPVLSAPPAPRPSPPRPAGRTILPPLELGGGSAGMAAGTGAPGRGGPGMDARLDQETARWLRWDKVKGAGGPGAPGGGVGPPARSPGAAPPFLRRVPVRALPSFASFLPSLPPRGAALVPPEDRGGGRGGGKASSVWLVCGTFEVCPGKVVPGQNQPSSPHGGRGLQVRERGSERGWSECGGAQGSCLIAASARSCHSDRGLVRCSQQCVRHRPLFVPACSSNSRVLGRAAFPGAGLQTWILSVGPAWLQAFFSGLRLC